MAIHTIKFIAITRGGNDGLIAVIEINGEQKYYDQLGVESLQKNDMDAAMQVQLQLALDALSDVDDYDAVPEFEGNIPEQGSLF
ncbi:MAG: hypothetical protein ACRBHB_11885 [Arenicella sp.]